MSTLDNLKEAFAGESQANRMYLAFAAKAEADGYPQVAKLFRAAAAAETIHAHAHFRAMGGIKSTADNLQAASQGEAYEYNSMYPPFVEEAQKEGNKTAEITFKNALIVEGIHHNLYESALQSVNAGRDLKERKVFVCEICGNTVYDDAEDKCSVCEAPRTKFTEIK
jgi:rubrerythrin